MIIKMIYLSAAVRYLMIIIHSKISDSWLTIILNKRLISGDIVGQTLFCIFHGSGTDPAECWTSLSICFSYVSFYSTVTRLHAVRIHLERPRGITSITMRLLLLISISHPSSYPHQYRQSQSAYS